MICKSRISEKPSTSYHLWGKSKLESFYPPNVHWYTSFYIGKISKSLTNEFNSVNDEILWNPISQIGKIIAFTTNMYFYPKNVLVSMITGVWKSKNSNIFILNSVNGGQSFLSKTNYDFFYSKLHPNLHRNHILGDRNFCWIRKDYIIVNWAWAPSSPTRSSFYNKYFRHFQRSFRAQAISYSRCSWNKVCEKLPPWSWFPRRSKPPWSIAGRRQASRK